ncbi:hypothetical protein ABID58_002162 [Bradyrhizobium sp. S3.2.6]
MIGTTRMLLCGFPALHFRAADRGCEVSTRPSLRPLGQEGGVTRQSSGEIRREGAKARLRFKCEGEEQSCCLILRHCERSEAIQSLSAEGFWIASLRSQRRWGEVRATDSALVPRTQCSVSSTVRRRAGAHVSEQSVRRGSRLRAATLRVAARPGRESINDLASVPPHRPPPHPAPSPPMHWTQTAGARLRSPRPPWSRTAPRG